MGIVLKEYSPHVSTVRVTVAPADVCYAAMRLTQEKTGAVLPYPSSKGLTNAIRNVIAMGHTSVLEHVSMTLELTGISRGCADQVMRHRMGSFTCSSTHYEAHEDIPHIVPHQLVGDTEVELALARLHDVYKQRRQKQDIGAAGAEARQLLPMAIECRLIWTVNARSLLNFLRLRLCRRNMWEIQDLARLVLHKAIEWFPEAFADREPYPECLRSACDQGSMACCIPYKRRSPLNEWEFI